MKLIYEVGYYPIINSEKWQPEVLFIEAENIIIAANLANGKVEEIGGSILYIRLKGGVSEEIFLDVPFL